MAVRVIDQGVHIVTAHCVSDKVHAVSLFHVFSNHNHIGYMIVIPVAIAIEPETRPEVRTRGKRIPK